MKLILKIVTIFLILAVLIATGCTESNNGIDETSEDESNAVSNVDKNETIVESEIEPIDESTIEGSPELKILAVTILKDTDMAEVVVKNVGNSIAEDVYCGVIVFGFSNEYAYSEYMTLEYLKEIVAPSIKEGVTGEVYEYETGYSYKGTPNLTIEYRLASIGYIGEIPAGKTEIGYTNIQSGTYKTEYMKVAWMDGNENEFVLY